MKRWIDAYCRALGWLIAGCLAVMVILVFGNVVLRYAFNSGITASEELSRWLFVWMTFLGAIVAIHERAHLGTDLLIARVGPAGRKAFAAVGLALMLYCCWLVFQGSLAMVRVNLDTTSPVLEWPMAFFHGAGCVFAVSGAVVLLHQAWELATGRTSDADLTAVRSSEE
jgi:TRAP-type C4-dicarboxylate transport system permease small subunit